VQSIALLLYFHSSTAPNGHTLNCFSNTLYSNLTGVILFLFCCLAPFDIHNCMCFVMLCCLFCLYVACFLPVHVLLLRVSHYFALRNVLCIVIHFVVLWKRRLVV
jgi:hypothetical protein